MGESTLLTARGGGGGAGGVEATAVGPAHAL